MSSVAEYLMNNAFKTVVIVGQTHNEIDILSGEILKKFIGMGGGVTAPQRGRYLLSKQNYLLFFTKTTVLTGIRGRSVDLLLFSYRVDQMSTLNNLRANITGNGGIGILFPPPEPERMDFQF